MSFDPEVHTVINQQIKEHVSSIPTLLSEIFPEMKKIWKFDDDFSFVYGWYIGRLECHAQHAFFDNMGRWPQGEEIMELKEMIELHAKEIRNLISQTI